MESLITDLWPIIAVIPALIIKITNDVKEVMPSYLVFVVPYLLWQILMVILWLVFNDVSFGIYAINWLILSYWAVAWYEFSRKNWDKDTSSTMTKEEIQEQIRRQNENLADPSAKFIPQD